MQNIIKSIFAGICIGIACLTSAGAGGQYIGAILFSVGLMLIVLNGYNLFTGKIGYASNIKYCLTYVMCFVFNAFGVFLTTLPTDITTYEIMINKLASPLPVVLTKAIGCGILMKLSIDIYRNKHSLIGVFTCVPAFILSGFEHSVADVFYIIQGGIYNWQVVMFLLTVLIGNTIGALLPRLVKQNQ